MRQETKEQYSQTDPSIPQSLSGIRESLIEATLSELGPLYIPFAYQWIQETRPDLDVQLIKLEERIENCNLSLFNDEEFKSLLQTYVLWHKAAIALYQKHSHIKGGDSMGFTIEAEELVKPGVYDVTITKLEETDGQFGERLKVTFELEDGRTVNGFFATKATPNNKTGRLFQQALGSLKSVNSDELIGKTVQVLIKHNNTNGNSYANVSEIL